MIIESVFSKEFAPYGKVISGYDVEPLLRKLREETPCPADSTQYQASDERLEGLEVSGLMQKNVYAGMPVQVGWCNGFNTKLNAWEYHRGSELDIPADDIILLLARVQELSDDLTISSDCARAFRVPAGTIAQIYETTLHFAPCAVPGSSGFRVAVVLPRGTNTSLGEHTALSAEDKLLWMRNKWLVSHAEGRPAAKGAFVGILGENIDLART
ncbi:MAG: DUF4867 family protein [Treponema sp.]|nr:DUF4867 family protein [Treponema sp.]